jgi:hypothetical protein
MITSSTRVCEILEDKDEKNLEWLYDVGHSKKGLWIYNHGAIMPAYDVARNRDILLVMMHAITRDGYAIKIHERSRTSDVHITFGKSVGYSIKVREETQITTVSSFSKIGLAIAEMYIHLFYDRKEVARKYASELRIL